MRIESQREGLPVPLDIAVGREVNPRELSGISPHLNGPVWVGKYPAHSGREFSDISGRHQESGLTIGDELHESSDAAGYDEGPGRHRLEHDPPEAFGQGRKDQCCRSRHVSGQLGLRHRRQEGHACPQIELLDPGREQAEILGIVDPTYDAESRLGRLPGNEREGFDETVYRL